MTTIFLIIILAILSGAFGRMGGAEKNGNWYDKLLDTNVRDVGCALIITLLTAYFTGWQLSFWWVYGLIFWFHFLAFRTYWDRLFGYDNLWFSGAVVGFSISPILFIDTGLWWVVALRTVIVCIVWGCLNKYLPNRILIWNRDVVEECGRYAVSL